MDINAELVLAPGTRLISAADLRPKDREKAGCTQTDTVLSRGGARARSKVLPPEGKRIVELFTSPRRIVDAVRLLGEEVGQPASIILEQAFPLLKLLINESLLVEAGKALEEAEPLLPAGSRVGTIRIIRCVQAYDDTALYFGEDDCGTPVALKVARNTLPATISLLSREAEFMAEIPAPPAPRLVAFGVEADKPWLAVEWIDGEPILARATSLRRSDASASERIDLVCKMLDAYAALHASGVVHGDVHPGNVIAGRDGTVRILDFGYARSTRPGSKFLEQKRGGVGFFFEPEYAAAAIEKMAPPPASFLGEQHALAVVAYLLITGRQYLDFSFDELRMFSEICDRHMRSFDEAGSPSWLEIEAVLARALEKEPARRFADVAQFALALRAASRSTPRAAPAPLLQAMPTLALALGSTIHELGPSGQFFLSGLQRAPTCSVHSGASGVAYGLLSIAGSCGEPDLLAAARHWSILAMKNRGNPAAYYSQEDDITPKSVGPSSLAHGAIGSAFVHGLVAGSCGDCESAREALNVFLSESKIPCQPGDLFLGKAGHLLAAARLLEALSQLEGGPDLSTLRAMGHALSAELHAVMVSLPPIGPKCTFPALGMAHGWAGLLYAQMAWARQCGIALSADLLARVGELRDCATETDHGLRWPIHVGGDPFNPAEHMYGWCNGGAGHVLLWELAAYCTGDAKYCAIADGASSDMLWGNLHAKHTTSFLCCGQVGAAYAMLAVYRRTGIRSDLAAAHALAEQAEARIRAPGLPTASFFRGALGLAVLVAQLERPEDALFPVFGTYTGRA